MKKPINKKNKEKIVKDVVCGMEKLKSQMKVRADYKGETYYFCWENDKKMSEANPEYWIPRKEKGI